MSNSEPQFVILSPVNNRDILRANLLRSPSVRASDIDVVTLENFPSASIAFNCAISRTEQPYLIFLHQDVYLPEPWLRQISGWIAEIELSDSNWGVIGVYGVGSDHRHKGQVWTNGIGLHGNFVDKPEQVVSVDEIVIILNRSSGLTFDESLQGFHLYGTDIVQMAVSMGHNSYVVQAPLVHNTNPIASLRGSYHKAFNFMRKKWRSKLPIPTAVLGLTRSGMQFWIREVRQLRNLISDRTSGTRLVPNALIDPEKISIDLGFEKHHSFERSNTNVVTDGIVYQPEGSVA